MKSLSALLTLAVLSWPWAAGAAEPPQPGSPAPEFQLQDGDGRMRQLADWRGRWLVLYFYPKDDTPGCTAEAIAFRDRLAELAALKADVAGVSLDDGRSHQAFADKLRLPFPLLSDAGGTVAQRYGSITNLGFMKFAKRHTFLIDPAGRVVRRYLDVDAKGHADEIIRDLKLLAAP